MRTKVLLTGAGCPGSATIVRFLRWGCSDVEVLGTDCNPHAGGRHRLDKFFRVPKGDSTDFIPEVSKIILKEKIDVILPQITADLLPLARAKYELGCPTLIAEGDTIALALDKGRLLGFCLSRQLEVPDSRVCSTPAEVYTAASELGYPANKIVLKPVSSKGGRGAWILDPDFDELRDFLSGRTADQGARVTNLERALLILERDHFPPLLLQEFLEGDEYTVTALCHEGRVLIGGNILRRTVRTNSSVDFISEENPELTHILELLVEALNYSWFINVQFKAGKIMEVNPRISTLVTPPRFSLPWLAIELALGRRTPDEIAELGRELKPSVNSTRFYDQVFYAA